ncbi:hypothetical protein DITRI_Ditri10aG0040900 [Diplodiscus trichospermus]
MEGSLVRNLERIYVFCGVNYGKDESYVKVVHRRRVLGIVPLAFTEKNLIGKTYGKELKVATMRERLLKMMEFGYAFIALPGGFGTLEELFQIFFLGTVKHPSETYRCAKC